MYEIFLLGNTDIMAMDGQFLLYLTLMCFREEFGQIVGEGGGGFLILKIPKQP